MNEKSAHYICLKQEECGSNLQLKICRSLINNYLHQRRSKVPQIIDNFTTGNYVLMTMIVKIDQHLNDVGENKENWSVYIVAKSFYQLIIFTNSENEFSASEMFPKHARIIGNSILKLCPDFNTAVQKTVDLINCYLESGDIFKNVFLRKIAVEKVNVTKVYVEQLLQNEIVKNENLNTILDLLKKLLEEDPSFRLPFKQASNLCKVLNKNELGPSKFNEADKRDEILDVLVACGKSDSEFPKLLQPHIETYYQISLTKGFSTINVIDKNLLYDVQLAKQLEMTFAKLIKLLINVHKLIPSLVTIIDIVNILEKINYGEDEIQALEKKAIEVQEEIGLKSDSDSENLPDVRRVKNEQFFIQQKLNNLMCRRCIYKNGQIKSLIMLLAQKIEDSNESQISLGKNTINYISNIDPSQPTEDNNKISLAIIQILSRLPAGTNIPSFTEKLISSIPKYQPEIIINLLNKNLQNNNNKHAYITYLTDILIECSEENIRNTSQIFLHTLYNDLHYDQQRILDVDMACNTTNDGQFLEECKRNVNTNIRVTFSCFKRLIQLLPKDQKVCDIVNVILHSDLQPLPKMFVESFKKHLLQFRSKIASDTIITICRLLLHDKYISFQDVCFIKNFTEDLNVESLNCIYDAVLEGFQINLQLVEKLKVLENTSIKSEEIVIANNILLALGRFCDEVCILRNPRENLERRKEALTRIRENKMDVSLIQTLEKLIQFDKDLQQEAFRTLMEIISSDIQTFPLNFKNILEQINVDCVQFDDIHLLVSWEICLPSNTAAILDCIVRKIYATSNPENLKWLKLLKDISEIPRFQNALKIILPDLHFMLCSFVDDDNKHAVSDLIEKCASLEVIPEDFHVTLMKHRTIKNLQKFDKNLIENIRDLMSIGYTFTNSFLKSIIRVFKDPLLHHQWPLYSDVFWEIYQHQGLTLPILEKFEELTSLNPNLLTINGIENILLNSLSENTNKTIDLSKILTNFYLNLLNKTGKGCEFNFFKEISCMSTKRKYAVDELKRNFLKSASYMSEKHQLSDGILRKLLEISSSEKEDFKNRYIALKSVTRQLTNYNFSNQINYIRKLVEITFSRTNNVEVDAVLTKLVFQCLERFWISKNPAIPGNYLIEYYRVFLSTQNYNNSWKPLSTFLRKNLNNNHGFNIINTLNYAIINHPKVDATIFTKCKSSLWARELMFDSLLYGIIKCHEDKDLGELDAKNFRDEIKRLETFLKLLPAKYGIEKVLQSLIDLQYDFSLNFHEIYDMLILLQSTAKAVDIIFKHHKIYKTLKHSLIRVWLEHQLLTKNIIFLDKEMEEASKYSCFSSKTLIKIVNLKDLTMAKLLKFLKKINEANLKRSDAETLIFRKCNTFEEMCSNLTNVTLKHMFVTRGATAADIKTNTNKLFNVNKNLALKKRMKQINETEFQEVPTTINDKETRGLISHDTDLVTAGWRKTSMKKLFETIKSKQDVLNCINCLRIINDYRLREYDRNVNGEYLIDILTTRTSETWENDIHSLGMFQINKGFRIKTAEELKEHLLINNSLDTNQVNNIFQQYQAIQTALSSKSYLLPFASAICEWNSEDIRQWANFVLKKQKVNDNQKLAVISRAIQLYRGYLPESTQILSVLILKYKQKNNGLILEKIDEANVSDVTIMLAILKALEGNFVDIMTGSREIAKIRAKDYRSICKAFGLNVGSVDGKENNKNVYKCNIVFGFVQDFQADILRETLEMEDIRNKRRFDVIIFEDINSMLIKNDGKNYVFSLPSAISGVNYLQAVVSAIWIYLEQAIKFVKEIDGKTYLIEDSNGLDASGEIIINPVRTLIPYKRKFLETVESLTEIYLRKLLRDFSRLPLEERSVPDDFPVLKIPKHFREFVLQTQLKKWIQGALTVRFKLKENVHYVLKENYVLQKQFDEKEIEWNDEIDVFLQIKHGVKITCDTFPTNLITTVEFCKLYDTNVYGICNVMGNNFTKEYLSRSYNVNVIEFPIHKQVRSEELTTLVSKNNDDWLQSIVESCISKLRNKRAVLVFTEGFEEIQIIREKFNKEYNCVVNFFTQDKPWNFEQVQVVLKQQQILIAPYEMLKDLKINISNIARRNGGPHVCVTFLPTNETVEKKVMSFFSKHGNIGTYQFVVLNAKITTIEDFKINKAIFQERCLQIAEKEFNLKLTQEKFFKEFCEMINNIKLSCLKSTSKEVVKIKIRYALECFGMWLATEGDKLNLVYNENDVTQSFVSLKERILEECLGNNTICNPSYYTRLGNLFIQRNKYDEAIAHFSKAIETDPDFCLNAHYYRAYAFICKNDHNFGGDNVLDEAINDFTKAKRLIEDDFEPGLDLVEYACKSHSSTVIDDIRHKRTIYAIQKQTIKDATSIITTAKENKIGSVLKLSDCDAFISNEILFEYQGILENCVAEDEDFAGFITMEGHPIANPLHDFLEKQSEFNQTQIKYAHCILEFFNSEKFSTSETVAKVIRNIKDDWKIVKEAKSVRFVIDIVSSGIRVLKQNVAKRMPPSQSEETIRTGIKFTETFNNINNTYISTFIVQSAKWQFIKTQILPYVEIILLDIVPRMFNEVIPGVQKIVVE